MVAPQERGQPRRRSIGEFMKSGDWSDYWTTRISRAEGGRIWVRGYPLEEIVEKLSFVEAMWLLLRGELPTRQQADIWELTMKVAMDQQLISSATSAARFVASAHPESPIPGVAAGILAHGSVTGSPRPAAEMIYQASELMARERLSREEIAARTVDQYLVEEGTVPGFGHPLHKETEPRAEILRRKVQELGGWGEKAQLFEAIHIALCQRLGKPLPINLAGMMAAVYCELGFEPVEIEALAAVGYGYAIVAHVAEEIREGVPLRVIPDALGAKYTGPAERHIPDDR
jgi:citryl-CoA lyase